MKIHEQIKNSVYSFVLIAMRFYWRIFKPVTYGARILLVTDTKVFLVQPRTLDYWNIPGGGIGKHEDSTKTALRELYEETEIKIDSVDYLLGMYTSNDEGKRDTVYIYVKKVDQEIAGKSDFEIGNMGWFAFDQLPEGTTPRTRMRIQEYLSGKQNISGLLKDLHI